MHERFLTAGLTALARAGAGDAIFGHWGAAVIAAYYFAEEQSFAPDVEDALTHELDRFMGEMGPWFEPLSHGGIAAESISTVEEALAENIDEFRGLGHNIIFGTLALKALRDMPTCRTPEIVDGIARLIHGFDDQDPGQPFPDWGDTRKVRVNASDGIPAYHDPATLALTALEAFAAIPRIYGGLHSGVVGHLLTVAHALLLLERMGYASLCERGCEAHRVFVKLSRHVPTDGDLLLRDEATPVLPFQAHFWAPTLQGQNEWAFGHVFKYAYSFFDLIQFVNDPAEITRYQEQLEYLYTWR